LRRFSAASLTSDFCGDILSTVLSSKLTVNSFV